jgi:hypothetical protein
MKGTGNDDEIRTIFWPTIIPGILAEFLELD